VNKCLQLNPYNRASIADILNHPKFAPVTKKLENGILAVNISRSGAPVNKKQEEVMSELSKFLQNKKYHESESDRIDKLVDQVKSQETQLEAEQNLCMRIFSEAQREMHSFEKAFQELKSQKNEDPNLRPFDQKYGPLSTHLQTLSLSDQRKLFDFNGRRERIKKTIELKQKTQQEFIFYNNRAKMLKDSDIRIKMAIEELGRESTDPEMVEKLMDQLHSDAMDEIMETVRKLPVDFVRNKFLNLFSEKLHGRKNTNSITETDPLLQSRDLIIIQVLTKWKIIHRKNFPTDTSHFQFILR